LIETAARQNARQFSNTEIGPATSGECNREHAGDQGLRPCPELTTFNPGVSRQVAGRRATEIVADKKRRQEASAGKAARFSDRLSCPAAVPDLTGDFRTPARGAYRPAAFQSGAAAHRDSR
jgi:hypothetical protein